MLHTARLRGAQARLERRHRYRTEIPDPRAANALTVADGTSVAGTVVYSDGSYFALETSRTSVGEYTTRAKAVTKRRSQDQRGRLMSVSRRDLEREADVILENAGCDTVTGAKKDRQYRRNKSAEQKRFARRWRARLKKLGTFGPASRVRVIEARED